MFRQIKLNPGNLTVAYKLLHDSLSVLLVFFVLALAAEGVLPGIIASHFGLYKIAILILGNILIIFGIQKSTGISTNGNVNKKIAWPLLFILALLIFNSLLKLHIFLNLFILAFIFAIAYFLLKTFQEE